MALIDNVENWSKLESQSGGIISSEIGNDYTLFNSGDVSFLSGKFGNGFYSPTAGASAGYGVASVNDTLKDYGAIECWWKPDYNLVSGIPSDGATHDTISIYQGGLHKYGIVIQKTSGIGLFVYNVSVYTAYASTGNVTAGTNNHLLLVWDRNSTYLNGSVTGRIYLNAIKIVETTLTAGADANTGWNSNINLTTVNNADAVIDNIKVYHTISESIITDILNNRNNEGFPVSVKRALANKYNFDRGLTCH